MICPNCNTPNDELANVCINCGQPLDTEETITSEQDRNAKLEEIQSRRLKKKKIQKRNRIIAICILIALILGALAYGVYTLRDNFFADGGDNLVISSPTPTLDTATEEPTEAPTQEPLPTEEIVATVAPETTPVIIPEPVVTAAPTKKPASVKPAATKKPVSNKTPIVSAPGFAAGSVIQTPVVQGAPIVSQLVMVNSVETAPNNRSIAKLSIGNEVYFAYAPDAGFEKGVPAMYSIDAAATADVYYGLPVYSITEVDAYDANGYVLAESSSKLLTEADLAGLSKSQLQLARNEIFARHGRIFKKQELQKFFESKTWYKPSSTYNYKNDNLNLTEIELKNANFILAYENK